MKAAAGTQGGDVPLETQFLLAEREDGDTASCFVPLIDGPFRAACRGRASDGLELVAETGDPATCGTDIDRPVRRRRAGPVSS